MSKDRAIPHNFEGEELESVFVGRRDGAARPTVILIPTVMGVSDLEKGFGRQLVELGYNSLVADLFGKEFHGAPRDTMFGEMNRLKSDRAALLRRLQHVLELARGLDQVQSDHMVVAGYCFGGMCALDLARDEEIDARQSMKVRLRSGVARARCIEVVLRVVHAIGGHFEQAECLFSL